MKPPTMNQNELGTLNDAALNRSIGRLASAVMIQAMDDVFRGTMRDRREALEWIRKGDIGQLTFELCCRIIDRDPETVRNHVMARTGIPAPFLDQLREQDKRERLAS
jgi:hypothetical protein